MIQRQKNECHPSKNGHLTPKTLIKKKGPLKTCFGVKSPYFYLKGPLLFSGVMINRLRNLFKGKKVGVAHKKIGIWPL